MLRDQFSAIFILYDYEFKAISQCKRRTDEPY
jgi:hypothetical protein